MWWIFRIRRPGQSLGQEKNKIWYLKFWLAWFWKRLTKYLILRCCTWWWRKLSPHNYLGPWNDTCKWEKQAFKKIFFSDFGQLKNLMNFSRIKKCRSCRFWASNWFWASFFRLQKNRPLLVKWQKSNLWPISKTL